MNHPDLRRCPALPEWARVAVGVWGAVCLGMGLFRGLMWVTGDGAIWGWRGICWAALGYISLSWAREHDWHHTDWCAWYLGVYGAFVLPNAVDGSLPHVIAAIGCGLYWAHRL